VTANFRLKPLLIFAVRVVYLLRDMKLLDIADGFGVAQGNQNIPAVSFFVFIDDYPWRTLVVCENITIA
jgi:hypothetical protein